VFIAPLRCGAGLKGKVIAALARGVPQVLSPVAAEGTALRHGDEVLIAESPEQWAASIDRLLADDSLWWRLSRAALTHARSHYGRTQGLAQMAAALGRLGLPIREGR
jgi:glycosyltransferase involved in cell wall biosynthesis